MAVYPSDLGSPSLKTAVAKMLAEPEGTVSYDFAGARRVALFNRSYATRWRFVLVRESR